MIGFDWRCKLIYKAIKHCSDSCSPLIGKYGEKKLLVLTFAFLQFFFFVIFFRSTCSKRPAFSSFFPVSVSLLNHSFILYQCYTTIQSMMWIIPFHIDILDFKRFLIFTTYKYNWKKAKEKKNKEKLNTHQKYIL